MSFLFSGVFWGVVLVLFGISVILNAVFHVHIPVIRILIALFFVYIGITILTGNSKRIFDGENIIFGDSTISLTGGKSTHNVIFGKGIIDLSRYELKDTDNAVNLNILFAGGIIRLNPDIPTVIKTDTAFGGARMPDGNTTAFGSAYYKTKNITDERENHLEIKASVVFGGLEIF